MDRTALRTQRELRPFTPGRISGSLRGNFHAAPGQIPGHRDASASQGKVDEDEEPAKDGGMNQTCDGTGSMTPSRCSRQVRREGCEEMREVSWTRSGLSLLL